MVMLKGVHADKNEQARRAHRHFPVKWARACLALSCYTFLLSGREHACEVGESMPGETLLARHHLIRGRGSTGEARRLVLRPLARGTAPACSCVWVDVLEFFFVRWSLRLCSLFP